MPGISPRPAANWRHQVKDLRSVAATVGSTFAPN